jgi:HEPN domain-containing protein
MADIQNARMLLGIAREDFAAMKALRNAENTTDRTFGFHAQQAVEKALKAWLMLLGVSYPYTHSLDTLLGLLEDEIGVARVAQFRDLDFLSPFAVQFRYSTNDDAGDELDRDGLLSQIGAMLEFVEAKL